MKLLLGLHLKSDPFATSQPWSIYHATSGSTQATFLEDISSMTSKSQEPKGTIDRNTLQVRKSCNS
jgi:hypothetical protein